MMMIIIIIMTTTVSSNANMTLAQPSFLDSYSLKRDKPHFSKISVTVQQST